MPKPRSSFREGAPVVALVLAFSSAFVQAGDSGLHPPRLAVRAESPAAAGPRAAPRDPAIPVLADSVARGVAPEAPPSSRPPVVTGNVGEGMYPVDLARLQRLLPDNSFWSFGDPRTKGLAAEARVDEEHRWNTMLGKVLSNTATEEEILSYYDHRRRVSEDYVAFSKAILAEYGAELPERDKALYELGISMHRTRIAETGREIDEALSRKVLQDQKRADYQRAKMR